MEKHLNTSSYKLSREAFRVGIGVLLFMAYFATSCDKETKVPNQVKDIDGNVYPVVIIGDLLWMGENLRSTRYADGTPIETGLTDAQWSSALSGAYAVFPHDIVPGVETPEQMSADYGLLYNWYAVTDVRGLCPAGWRVVSDLEWLESEMEISERYGAPAGKLLKSCRQENSPQGGDCATTDHPRWNQPRNEDNVPLQAFYGTDNYGFHALPGGLRSFNGQFASLGLGGYWWTASNDTPDGNPANWVRFIVNTRDQLDRTTASRQYGLSVRCVRDLP